MVRPNSGSSHGLMNAAWMSRKPGGQATVKLYQEYKGHLEALKR